MKVGIYYGSTMGNTANAAKSIKAELDSVGQVDLLNISDSDIASMADYDLLILGSSTWGSGEVQDDWSGKESLDGISLTGKKAAVFGTGDQYAYADTFVDAIGILADSLAKAGAALLGKWPTDGYDFDSSTAARGGSFVGLVLDDDNQSNKTDERIKQWTQQLKDEL